MYKSPLKLEQTVMEL